MKLRKSRALCSVLMAAAVTLAAGCGGGASSEEAASEGVAETTAKAPATQAAGRSDMPPDDFVPYRCMTCSCRVFVGDGANCGRPTCDHHWSVHIWPDG